MSNFINQMNQTQASTQLQRTENGALGYVRTTSPLVDMNFKTSSYRNLSEEEIINDFEKAYSNNPDMAILWAFYARDIRGGMGERRLFRVIMNHLADTQPDMVANLLNLFSEYGRWDDILCLLDTKVENDVYWLIALQLVDDIKKSAKGEPHSLLAKWLPSINRKSKTTSAMGKRIAKEIGLTPKQYGLWLSALRKNLNIVEQKMSANEWDEIDYSTVASRANVLYNKAFFKHDTERRLKYLEKVEKGEDKINGGTNFPHDIVHQYGASDRYGQSIKYDGGLEALWKALPQYGDGLESTIVVRDGSGSMYSEIGKSKTTANDVATALSIYFAERCKGEFKDNFITFSETPQLVNLSNCKSLFEKLNLVKRYNEVANTDVEAVFDLILNTAVSHELTQEEIPSTILIVSDMEFDEATESYSYDKHEYICANETLFETIRIKFEDEGYKLPRLVFWNVTSRTNTIPVIANESGVSLVSGFSPASINIVLTGKANPEDALYEVLTSERYAPVMNALSMYE